MTQEQRSAFSYRISQASKTQLVEIMIEIMECNVIDGMQAYEQGEREAFRQNMKQAKRACDALCKSLDLNVAIAADIYVIYAYIGRQLSQAIFKKTITDMEVVMKVIQILKKTFQTLSGEDTTGPVMQNAQKVYAGLTYSNGKLNELAYDIHSGNASRGYTV